LQCSSDLALTNIENDRVSKLPKISVVVPNFNYEKFLGERLESAINQTFRDVEIIFLDDASSDGSVAYVQRQFGTQIDRIELNQVNSGNPFVQWNRGVRAAQGEYVWIAEADDTCTPVFLEKMLRAIEQSHSIGLAYCSTVPIDTSGNVLNAGFHQQYLADLDPDRWAHDFVAGGRDEVRRYIARKNTITNVSGVLFRREAYLSAGGAPEHLRRCGDWLTYFQILHDWDVAFVSEPMNFHRQHPTKHTHNSVLNLTYFQEFLLVQRYVAEVFELQDEERKDAFNRFLGEWDRLTISSYGRIDIGRMLELSRLAAATYREPAELAQIGSHLVKNAMKSLAAKCFAH
jgi:glycosyltransferase involved in cell wall biosynthesis